MMKKILNNIISKSKRNNKLLTLKREKELFKSGIYFLDCGTSGGLDSARYGACFMIDGRNEGIKIAEPGQL
jgi:6-phosphogluconate dehydrogenase (decarboxylating)